MYETVKVGLFEPYFNLNTVFIGLQFPFEGRTNYIGYNLMKSVRVYVYCVTIHKMIKLIKDKTTNKSLNFFQNIITLLIEK
jgi:hypothetical protein